MALVDMSKQCKHLRSLGEQAIYGRDGKRPIQVVDKGFRCEIGKFPPPKCGPKVCVARKRECFESRAEPEAAPDETPAAEEKPEE